MNGRKARSRMSTIVVAILALFMSLVVFAPPAAADLGDPPLTYAREGSDTFGGTQYAAVGADFAHGLTLVLRGYPEGMYVNYRVYDGKDIKIFQSYVTTAADRTYVRLHIDSPGVTYMYSVDVSSWGSMGGFNNFGYVYAPTSPSASPSPSATNMSSRAKARKLCSQKQRRVKAITVGTMVNGRMKRVKRFVCGRKVRGAFSSG